MTLLKCKLFHSFWKEKKNGETQKGGNFSLNIIMFNIHTSLPLTRTLKFPILLHELLYGEYSPVEEET